MKQWERRLRRFIYSGFALSVAFAAAFGVYHVSGKRAESEMVASDSRCSCEDAQLQGDPYERPLQYKFGAFAGHCIDSCEYRNSQILSAEENDKLIWVSNVQHKDRFWTAKVPVSSVKSVEIFFENFRKSFNHVAFRFEFKASDPVELTIQNPLPGEPVLTETTESLIISPEGVPPAGEVYNLKDGMLGNYALLYRLFSVEQYELFTVELNRTLRSYKTKLNRQETRDLLMVSLQKSSEGLNGVYQLLFNNCATATLDLVLDSKKKLISESWDVWDVVDPFRGIPLTQPIGTLSSLRWWQVIDANSAPEVYSPGMPIKSQR
jgi:hypothetical protein